MMKKDLLFKMLNAFTLLFFYGKTVNAQFVPPTFYPEKQDTVGLQYFKPDHNELFAGDPMPFFHNGEYHLYYLVDFQHHQGLGGLGGHEWAHMSTKDLVHWKHYPMALPLTMAHEKSMCTGSVIYNKGMYYAFYAPRTYINNIKAEHINVAESKDGINFLKKKPDTLLLLPSKDFVTESMRDPEVFWDEQTKLFYMVVTAAYSKPDFPQKEGVLIYYTSVDLKNWSYKGPFLIPGLVEGSIPECSNLFKWNQWYYLVFSENGGTRYRISDKVTGPWVKPLEDNLGNDFAVVFKSAAFVNNRRIAVGFIPSRENNKDYGRWLYGGNLIFREWVQNKDGSLSSVFPKEMLPATSEKIKPEFEKPIEPNVKGTPESFEISALNGFEGITLKNIPTNARITCTVEPKGAYSAVGLLLRKSEKGSDELSFSSDLRRVKLGNNSIFGIMNLEKPFTVEIIMKDDIVEVCINNKRCHANRCPEQQGNMLGFYCVNGQVVFKDLKIFPLIENK